MAGHDQIMKHARLALRCVSARRPGHREKTTSRTGNKPFDHVRAKPTLDYGLVNRHPLEALVIDWTRGRKGYHNTVG